MLTTWGWFNFTATRYEYSRTPYTGNPVSENAFGGNAQDIQWAARSPGPMALCDSGYARLPRILGSRKVNDYT